MAQGQSYTWAGLRQEEPETGGLGRRLWDRGRRTGASNPCDSTLQGLLQLWRHLVTGSPDLEFVLEFGTTRQC